MSFRTTSTGSLRVSLASLLLAITVIGCVDDIRHAGRVVDAYLTALRDPASDRGWSLLHPTTRREVFGDEEAVYRDEVQGIDWTTLRWRVVSSVNDDPDLAIVTLEIDGSPAVREFLSTPRPGGFLVAIYPDSQTSGTMLVRMSNGPGVWPYGG